MILVDANILIYAHVSSSPYHKAARRWLEDQLNSTSQVGLPWPSLLAFVRLVTNPRIFEHPVSLAEAWNRVEEWLALPSVWIPQPTERHAQILGDFLKRVVDRSSLVPDAHIAALAIEHGLTLYSTDRDFARFPGLKWSNPLQHSI
ncbi:MAG: type II toxin-antitoxin system VapC family toxin [Candidatus Bipolaricaulota bacterium]|nr:type II toxin-antitoxin system VapC family toxin [Candidatus Bipolaricaulota bacterium]